MLEQTNRGVIIQEPTPTDYIAGSSPLVINTIFDGDNRKYKPSEEPQSGTGGDKMDCVTVSSGNCIETILNGLIAIGNLRKNHLDWLNKWGFIVNGVVKTSSRWAAIQNGTNNQGNSAQVVAEWWRKNGFIPEALLPNDQTMDWNTYYDKSCITDEMRKCASESLKYFKINYEWVYGDDNELKFNLKRGAIQILTAVCSGWNNDNPVKNCYLPVQHATELLCVDDIRYIFDQYNPFNKQLSADYTIPYRILYMLEPIKQQVEYNFIKDTSGAKIYGLTPMADTTAIMAFCDANNIPYTKKPTGDLDWSSVRVEVVNGLI